MNEYSKSKAKDFTCGYCGKYRKRGICNFVSWDVGYAWEDNDSEFICWKCEIEGKICGFINRLKSIKISLGKNVSILCTRKHMYVFNLKKLTIHKLKR